MTNSDASSTEDVMASFSLEVIRDELARDFERYQHQIQEALSSLSTGGISGQSRERGFLEISEACHALRGVCSLVGAWGVVYWCEDFEAFARYAASHHADEPARLRHIVRFMTDSVERLELLGKLTLEEKFQESLDRYAEGRALIPGEIRDLRPRRESQDLLHGRRYSQRGPYSTPRYSEVLPMGRIRKAPPVPLEEEDMPQRGSITPSPPPSGEQPFVNEARFFLGRVDHLLNTEVMPAKTADLWQVLARLLSSLDYYVRALQQPEINQIVEKAKDLTNRAVEDSTQRTESVRSQLCDYRFVIGQHLDDLQGTQVIKDQPRGLKRLPVPPLSGGGNLAASPIREIPRLASGDRSLHGIREQTHRQSHEQEGDSLVSTMGRTGDGRGSGVAPRITAKISSDGPGESQRKTKRIRQAPKTGEADQKQEPEDEAPPNKATNRLQGVPVYGHITDTRSEENRLADQRAQEELLQDQELVSIFKSESLDLLNKSESTLLSWDGGDKDPITSSESFQRTLHTLKGAASSLGLNAFAGDIHEVEGFLSEVPADQLGSRQLGALLRLVDEARDFVAAFGRGGEPPRWQTSVPAELRSQPEEGNRMEPPAPLTSGETPEQAAPAEDEELASLSEVLAEAARMLDEGLQLWQQPDDSDAGVLRVLSCLEELIQVAETIGIERMQQDVTALRDLMLQSRRSASTTVFKLVSRCRGELREYAEQLLGSQEIRWPWHWADAIRKAQNEDTGGRPAGAGQGESKDARRQPKPAGQNPSPVRPPDTITPRTAVQRMAVMTAALKTPMPALVRPSQRMEQRSRQAGDELAARQDAPDNRTREDSESVRLIRPGIPKNIPKPPVRLDARVAPIERTPRASESEGDQEEKSALGSGSTIPAVGGHQSNLLQVEAESMKSVLEVAGSLLTERSRLSRKLTQLRAYRQELRRERDRLSVAVRTFMDEVESFAQASSMADSVRERLGEKVETLSRVFREITADLQEIGDGIEETTKRLDEGNAQIIKNTRQLQRELAGLNSIPADSLFRRLRRVFRDALQSSGKEAEISFSGESTRIDRLVLERITGALTHLVRNAVAHGIEKPEIRESKGKSRTGSVTVTATQLSSQICLEVVDDGAGIDEKAVRQKAIDRGLIPDDSMELRRDEVLDLLFTGGFSTSETVNGLAGRGIGLDVVRTEVESLGGTLRLTYDADKGCKWTLQLPLTLSMAEVAVIKLSGQRFAIPLAFIEGGIRLNAKDIIEENNREFLRLGDSRIPVGSLWHLLGLTSPADLHAESTNGLILNTGGYRVAMRIGQVVGREEAVVKSLSELLAHHPMYSGATYDSEGHPLLILNAPNISTLIRAGESLVELAREGEETEAKPSVSNGRTNGNSSGREKLIVLVVDDSLSVRQRMTRALTELGCEVIAAMDGVEALEKMRKDLPGLIFTDLEMPRMSGYELIVETRSIRDWENIPIYVNSSRGSKRHEDKALKLGATGYLTKPAPLDSIREIVTRAKAGILS